LDVTVHIWGVTRKVLNDINNKFLAKL